MSATSNLPDNSLTGPDWQEAIASLVNRVVCPFCAHVVDKTDPDTFEACPKCKMEDNTHTRHTIRARLGPWYVYQHRNPAAPGMRFSTLLSLIRRGKVPPRAVVRGPTTHQMWKFAARVRGISREWGFCYRCEGAVRPTDETCAHCGKSQQPPAFPDALDDSPQGKTGQSLTADGPLVSVELPAQPAPSDGRTSLLSSEERAAEGLRQALTSFPSSETRVTEEWHRALTSPSSSEERAMPAVETVQKPSGETRETAQPGNMPAAGESVLPNAPVSVPAMRATPAANQTVDEQPVTDVAPMGKASAPPRVREAPFLPTARQVEEAMSRAFGTVQGNQTIADAGSAGPKPQTILSAADLASVFKLRMPDVPAAAHAPRRTARRKVRGIVSLVLLLVLLAIAGGAILAYVDPVFRQKAIDLSHQVRDQTVDLWHRIIPRATPAAPKPSEPMSAPAIPEEAAPPQAAPPTKPGPQQQGVGQFSRPAPSPQSPATRAANWEDLLHSQKP